MVTKEVKGTIGTMSRSIMSNTKVVMVCAALIIALGDGSILQPVLRGTLLEKEMRTAENAKVAYVLA